MNRGTKWVIGAVLATTGVVGAGALYANQKFEESGYMQGFHRGHHGKARAIAKLCGDARNEHIEDVINVVESFVDMTPEQMSAWVSFTDEVRASSTQVGETCDEVLANGRPNSIPDRLVLAEILLGAGLDVMRKLRPEFTAFYETLDENQKSALERLAKHRHHR